MTATVQNLEPGADQAVAISQAIRPFRAPPRADLHPARTILVRPARRRPALRTRDCRNLILAARHAEQIGTPLDCYAVIELHDAPGRAHDALANILERLGKQLAYRGIRRAWIWTLERGGLVGHLHANIALHAGAARSEIRRILRQLAAAALREDLPKHAVKAQPVRDLDGLLRYITKGSTPAAQRLVKRMTPRTLRRFERTMQGLVPGKRCGCSETLGPTARRRRPVGESPPALAARPCEISGAYVSVASGRQGTPAET